MGVVGRVEVLGVVGSVVGVVGGLLVGVVEVELDGVVGVVDVGVLEVGGGDDGSVLDELDPEPFPSSSAGRKAARFITQSAESVDRAVAR